MTSTDAHTRANAEWRTFIEPLLTLGEQAGAMWPETDGDDELRHDLWWFMYSQVGAGFMTLAVDEEHPDWFPCWGQTFNNIGNINPDGTYYMTPINDQGVYRLRGHRGSLRIVDIQLGDGSVFVQGRLNDALNFGPTLANYDLDYDLTLGGDGWFDVLLCRERPDGHEGDWWALPEGTNYALVRQFAYDWVGEVDARIAIDRLDTPAARPRRSPEFIRERLGRVAEYVHAHQRTMDVPAHAEKGSATPR